MNQRTASKPTRSVRLALLAAVVLLGGCATHSTRYYADAGYGYYDPVYADPWHGGSVVSTSFHVGSYYGFRDPWFYPYSSLDLFYFGPFAYRSSIALYSHWGYVPFRYRYPYAYSFGYGHGYAGAFGHGYYGWGWPGWSSSRYYGHSGHRDRHPPPVDARVRALSYDPVATPTRRGLLGSWRTTQPTSGVTNNPSRSQLISRGSTRSALRGELGGDPRNRSAVRGAPAPAVDRSRVLSSSDSGRRYEPRSIPRAADSRRALSAGSAREMPRVAPRSVEPAPQSRAIQNRQTSERAVNNRSRVLDRSPGTRSPNIRSSQSASAPANRVQNRAPAPVTRSNSRAPQAAPPPQQRSISAPAAVRPATPPPARSPARAVRPSAPPPQSSSRDRRREALSGRRDDGRRD